jgi:hypothetical protein
MQILEIGFDSFQFHSIYKRSIYSRSVHKFK